MQELDGEPNSETHIELMSVTGGLGTYRLRPRTGRKHQLRVHMSGLGVPICNDNFYPELKAYAQSDDFSRPLQLLARRSEEHTSELQSLMRISYAVFCLNKKTI